MGDPPYVTSKPVRQDLRGSPWSAGQANSAERWLWKTVFRRLSTCLSTGILNIIVYHIICGKSTPYCGKLYEFHKISTWKPAETVESKNGQKTGVFHRRCSVESRQTLFVRYCLQAATAKRGHRSRLPRCRNAVLLLNAGAAGGIVFVKNVKNRQKIRAACPKQLWRTCGKRKKAENFAKKFAGGLDK